MDSAPHNEYGFDDNSDEDTNIQITQPYPPSINVMRVPANSADQENTNLDSSFDKKNQYSSGNQRHQPVRAFPIGEQQQEESSDAEIYESIDMDDLEENMYNLGLSNEEKEIIYEIIEQEDQPEQYRILLAALCKDEGLTGIMLRNLNVLLCLKQFDNLDVSQMLLILTSAEEDGRKSSPEISNVGTQANGEATLGREELDKIEEQVEILHEQILDLKNEKKKIQKDSQKEIEEINEIAQTYKNKYQENLKIIRELSQEVEDLNKASAKLEIMLETKEEELDQIKDDKYDLQETLKDHTRMVDSCTSEVGFYKRKVKDLHDCLFSKPEEIIKLLKTDTVVLNYLDRIYQDKILSYKDLDKRLRYLECIDMRHKRSHSYDYLPRISEKDDVSHLKISNKSYKNEYDEIILNEDRKEMSLYLSQKKLDKPQRQSRSNERASNIRNSQNRADSFINTSMNNSFMGEYAAHEWYSSNPGQKPGKHFQRTPGVHDNDANISKAYTGVSETSGQKDHSKYHRRIASEDLIMEEDSDVPKIDYSDQPKPNARKLVADVLKDIKCIFALNEKALLSNQQPNSDLNNLPEFSTLIFDFCVQLYTDLSSKFTQNVDPSDLPLQPPKSQAQPNSAVQSELASLQNSYLMMQQQNLQLQEQLNQKSSMLNEELTLNLTLKASKMNKETEIKTQRSLLESEFQMKIMQSHLDTLTMNNTHLQEQAKDLHKKINQKESEIEYLKKSQQKQILSLQEAERIRAEQDTESLRERFEERLVSSKEEVFQLSLKVQNLEHEIDLKTRHQRGLEDQVKKLHEKLEYIKHKEPSESHDISDTGYEEYVYEAIEFDQLKKNNRVLENRVKELERMIEKGTRVEQEDQFRRHKDYIREIAHTSFEAEERKQPLGDYEHEGEKNILLKCIKSLLKSYSKDKMCTVNLENVDLSSHIEPLLPVLTSTRKMIELNLNNTNLPSSCLSLLSKLIQSNSNLQSLKIGSNPFSSTSLCSFFSSLSSNRHQITSLDISQLDCGKQFSKFPMTMISKSLAINLIAFIEASSGFRSLCLKGCFPSACSSGSDLEAANIVFANLADSLMLCDLDLSQCVLSEAVMSRLFSPSCRMNLTSLTILRSMIRDTQPLEEYLLTKDGLQKFHIGNIDEKILNCIGNHRNLRDLMIEQVTLSHASLETLRPVVRNLRYLEIKNCDLGDQIALCLFDEVLRSKSIFQVVCSGNKLTDIFIKELVDRIQEADEEKEYFGQKYSTLKNLSLASNKISDIGAECLADIFGSCNKLIKSLEILDLCDNIIYEKGINMIKRSLKNNSLKLQVGL
ncbi:unnamed protein product [Moneuplotes crassus]|uniref:Uncharacterized protein n=1 Tax=Euplotes crassus TaxID=5936 RepID=A0AAD1UBY7_EUPCR|nr:unnamed protein product [Moneuplotes crassus]